MTRRTIGKQRTRQIHIAIFDALPCRTESKVKALPVSFRFELFEEKKTLSTSVSVKHEVFGALEFLLHSHFAHYIVCIFVRTQSLTGSLRGVE